MFQKIGCRVYCRLDNRVFQLSRVYCRLETRIFRLSWVYCRLETLIFQLSRVYCQLWVSRPYPYPRKFSCSCMFVNGNSRILSENRNEPNSSNSSNCDLTVFIVSLIRTTVFKFRQYDLMI